ncbi:hypothetical protein KGQ20_37315, partial [Catenulispora sp. NF23]|uniref:acyl-CoA dehydrogenase family protein n=1 Tax=Catenulispora pinistramenti TaxID=2705254 RepID=UPI001BACDEEF
IHHASGVLLGINLPGRSGPAERCLALVRPDEITVQDTWHTAGMRGTGSDTVAAKALPVPPDRLLRFSEITSGAGARRHRGEPRVHFPVSINLPLVGTVIGAAQAVLAEVVLALANGKRSTSPLHERAADLPAHQLNVADAAVAIDTARLHAVRAADQIDAAAVTGRDLSLETRARLRLDMSHATRTARLATGLLLNVAGAGAFGDDTSLQRAWRDIETASRHAALSTEISREIYGRVLIGLDLPTASAI